MISPTSSLQTSASRRFDLALFIIHPTLSPTEITAGIGLQPHFVHAIGEQRTTPAGTLLPGEYKDTRWRHCIRHEVQDQRFVPILENFVDSMSRHGAFFERVKSTGGSTCLMVSFLGDGHFGDALPTATLAKIADLQLDLGIEVFSAPQQ
jgi:hypothetical protein